MELVARSYGAQSMTAPLRRVLVVAPRPEEAARWREAGWRAAPDPARLAAEHEAFRGELEAAGVELVVSETSGESGLDGVYPYDPALVTRDGAILLRPGKDSRLNEVEPLGQALNQAGVPTAARIEPPASIDGGDTCWLDERTLLVGLGYRTNEAGAAALRAALPDVDVIAYDLPHHRGRAELLHLMSIISPLADDLAVVYLPLLPVRLVELLADRGIELVEVPDDELATQGPNLLALAPRVALALDGNPETRRRLEAAGVDVRVYRGDELSHKGEGGPTCLTRPILRG
ncbi:MAG TPA: arginine deiminase family protein [Gaiellaceae bacterium]|nr:arginine deiminase family protein [Gaiellaceae bacterium]